MAIAPRLNTATLALELQGSVAGLLRSVLPPAYRVDRGAGPLGMEAIVRAGAVVTVGDLRADLVPDQDGALLAWAMALAGGSAALMDGAVLVLDANKALRRRIDFRQGWVTELALPTLSAGDGRRLFTIGLAWRSEAVSEGLADGAKPSLGKARKGLSVANYRVLGLPFDASGVVEVGLPTLRVLPAATDPRRTGRADRPGVDRGELVLGLAGRSREAGQAWLRQVLADGEVDGAENLDLAVEMLDPSLKKVLATISLRGCALLASDESRIDSQSESPPRLSLRLAVRELKMGCAAT